VAVSALQAWREEARQDRLTQARIDRDRDAARVQAHIAERQADARLRREEAQARGAARTQARKAGAARRAARMAWLSAHVVDLLFVPVIVVPAVLAWAAMAAYGTLLYGPAGLALPAFSEGAMWAFAAATTITRRRHPERPLWHLRLGTVVFAAVGAALNFAHGLTVTAGPHGPVTGIVYAVVSVAGVTVHQLVTAGPRRARADRDAARLARAAGRREKAARRAALRDAVIHIDEHGGARLACQVGPVTLTQRHGRTRLDPVPAFPRPVPHLLAAGPVCQVPEPVPAPAPEGVPRTAPAGAPGSAPAPGRTRTRKKQVHRTAERALSAVTAEDAEVHFAAELADGRVPSARQIKAELHVGQDRAREIRAHLSTVANAPREHIT
jgi:hypothetical protein